MALRWSRLVSSPSISNWIRCNSVSSLIFRLTILKNRYTKPYDEDRNHNISIGKLRYDNLNEFAQPTTANFAAVVTDFKQQVKNVNDSSDLRLVGLKLDLEAMMNRFQQTLKEEAEEVAMGKLEVSKRSCIVEWMVEVRAVVWPESPEKIALGSPREDGVAAVATSLQAEATLLGIDRIPDVVFILDCFEWLAWCYQSLLILREPVQTSLLRKHVGQARRIKCNDEKIVKFLMAGLSRAA